MRMSLQSRRRLALVLAIIALILVGIIVAVVVLWRLDQKSNPNVSASVATTTVMNSAQFPLRFLSPF